MKTDSKIEIPLDKIEVFCRKWKIKELSLFGSVLREDFRPDSDVDFLVTFEEEARWSFYDMVDMQDELKRSRPGSGLGGAPGRGARPAITSGAATSFNPWSRFMSR